ncbi:MAG: hypothetical protein FJ109_18135 [Deltaproteobacteria bacterium]|nr:hypothetical protein [Deltaproteobacteria bacterium]
MRFWSLAVSAVLVPAVAVLVLVSACNGGTVVVKPDTEFYVDFGPPGDDSRVPGDSGDTVAGKPQDVGTDHKVEPVSDILPETGPHPPCDKLLDCLSDAVSDKETKGGADILQDGQADAIQDTGEDGGQDSGPDGGQDAGADGGNPCLPDCAGKQCGSDGCGGSCGSCPGAQDQCLDGKCSCFSDCAGKQCGDDGCGGSCGMCPPGLFCQGAVCVANPCVPECAGKQCGDDGCGGSCGTCPGGQQCDGAQCKADIVAGTLASSFRGTTLIRNGHDYGPTIVQDGGSWHMWWCGAPSQPGAWDSVWYASSPDGLNWTCPVEAIKVTKGSLDGSAVCDPDVVKVGGTWYLYYTGINSDFDWSNRVFLATAGSPGGPWTKHPSNDNPQPVLQDPACNGADPNDYCVGQSTVVYKNGLFHHWYTDSGKGKGAPPSPLVTMLATSADGINYTVQNNGQPVFNHADASVKLDTATGLFVMIYGNVDDNQLYWTTSADGINWLPHDGARNIDVNFANGQNHNPGMAGNVHGHFSGTTFVMYGAGTGWGIWDMDRSEVVFGPGAAAPAMCALCAPGNSCGAVCGGLGYCGAPGSANPNACCTCPGNSCGGGQGCSGCLGGKFDSCKKACQAAGFPTGTCAFPGSKDPTKCCQCSGWTACQGCLDKWPDCAAACQSTGAVGGSCAYPESTDPQKCCVCQWDDCKGCLGGQPSCDAACKAAGYPTGKCEVPGSTDPAVCCSCQSWTNCQGCLGGFPDCPSACQASGFSTGTCKIPDSTNPLACCECKFDSCKGCLGGFPDCPSACQASGFSTGTCKVPDSTDPLACCECKFDDCKGCLGGQPSCDAACQAAGYPSGTCPVPDSTNPSQCCSCQPWTNCQGCLGGYSNCADACHHSGKPDGWCAYPESTNTLACCACAPDTGCEGCLGGKPSCMAACQAAGKAGGWCAIPGSQNPSACCTCF